MEDDDNAPFLMIAWVENTDTVELEKRKILKEILLIYLNSRKILQNYSDMMQHFIVYPRDWFYIQQTNIKHGELWASLSYCQGK